VVYTLDGAEVRLAPTGVVSTIPVSDLVEMLRPPAPGPVLEAARGLRYRDMVIAFITLKSLKRRPRFERQILRALKELFSTALAGNRAFQQVAQDLS